MKWLQRCGQLNGYGLVLASMIFAVNACRAQSVWSVVDRGSDSKTLQKITVQNGTNCVHQIHVIATGLNYTNSSGELVESSDQITLQPDGSAAATQGRHKVLFPADIYNGVLQVTTPDGRNLYSRPLCVCYDDGSNIVVIATLTNSIGCLTDSNQVTYQYCFCGGIRADIVASYKHAGFECDLVFHSRPNAPSAYGLSDANSTIELVTEFFNTTDPQQIPAVSDDWFGLQDDTLKFGKLTMTRGKAFAFGNANTNTQPLAAPKSNEGGSTPVYKSWIHSPDGRKFLVEQVPLAYVAAGLDTLPLTASIQKPASGIQYFASSTTKNAKKTKKSNQRQGIGWRFTSVHPAFPPSHGILADTNRILLATADFKQTPGVVLDYTEILGDQGDITFTPGTWFVAGPVYCNNTTIQGGAIFKYPYSSLNSSDTPSWDAFIEIDGSITCPDPTGSPAYFTAADDDSLGDSMNGVWDGYTGVIQDTSGSGGGFDGYGSPALSLPTNPNAGEYGPFSFNLTNLRIRDAQVAVFVGYDNFVTLSDSQVTASSALAVLNDGGNGGSGTLSLTCDNCLLSSNATLVMDDTSGQNYYYFNDCTMDNCQWLVGFNGNGVSVGNLFATNCIIADMDDNNLGSPAGDYNGFYNINNGPGTIDTDQFASSAFPFATANFAHYYLAPNCSFHQVGTTQIAPGLLADLQTRTTYTPQDGAYLDAAGTDLGYHYSVNESSANDGVADSWKYYWFGNYTNSASELDVNGNTLLYDYHHNLDPIVLQFGVGISTIMSISAPRPCNCTLMMACRTIMQLQLTTQILRLMRSGSLTPAPL